ncbi:MAG: mreC [Rickettsiales bacterium]|jgi:rod shape-determining protein MreC|nr:mreC [Rickettsiales bacterium]
MHRNLGYRSKTSTLASLAGKGKFPRLSFFLFLAAAIALLIVGRTEEGYIELLRTRMIDATVPIIDVLSRPVDGIRQISASIEELATIRKQNKVLRAENERLRQTLMHSIQMESENTHLRNLLNFIKEPNPDFITARIVGDTSSPFAQSAILSAGSDQRVRKGQAVVNNKGLVGRIIEVGARSSRVLLVTDINSRIPIVTSETRERGILAGNNDGSPKLLYLSDNNNVKEGEVVLTSGDGDVFPANQPIGKVIAKGKDVISVEPFVEWNRMEFVSVVDY